MGFLHPCNIALFSGLGLLYITRLIINIFRERMCAISPLLVCVCVRYIAFREFTLVS